MNEKKQQSTVAVWHCPLPNFDYLQSPVSLCKSVCMRDTIKVNDKKIISIQMTDDFMNAGGLEGKNCMPTGKIIDQNYGGKAESSSNCLVSA